METTIQNEASENLGQEAIAQSINQVEAGAEQIANVQDSLDPNHPSHPDHPDHQKHMSALHAAGLSHSAVGHVMPHHRGIDL